MPRAVRAKGDLPNCLSRLTAIGKGEIRPRGSADGKWIHAGSPETRRSTPPKSLFLVSWVPASHHGRLCAVRDLDHGTRAALCRECRGHPSLCACADDRTPSTPFHNYGDVSASPRVGRIKPRGGGSDNNGPRLRSARADLRLAHRMRPWLRNDVLSATSPAGDEPFRGHRDRCQPSGPSRHLAGPR